MHELSLATAMIDDLEQAARRESASRITAVHVVVGALSGVEREPLEFCFPLAAEGTLADGARLVIEDEPVRIVCKACGADSEPALPDLSCPACRALAVEVVSGREFRVRSMEVE